MLKVDAHQHFWQFDPVRDSWITPDMAPIRRDFFPADLMPLLQANGVSACVAVQADQSDAETGFLLGLADEHEFIAGVVGWIDLRSPAIDELLQQSLHLKKLKGFRHIIQAEHPGFMADPAFNRGVAALSRHGFTYDILIRYTQLPEAISFAGKHPGQRFVLDHIAKPDIRGGELTEWEKGIRQLAELPNVCCKLSGLITEADLTLWKAQDIYPYLDKVFEYFGAARLMFGSDWPVCRLAGEYETVAGLLDSYLSRLSKTEQEAVWARNAIGFYNLDN